MPDTDALREGARLLGICNACRYCEGYCAVFPAMERRLDFPAGDIRYLANLCHQCGECYYACQYAPPHEFAVNVPKILAEIRAQSYRRYVWPAMLARVFDRNSLLVALVTLAALVGAFFVAAMTHGSAFQRAIPGGDFYALVPHNMMIAIFGAAALFVLVAFGISFVRGWRDINAQSAARLRAPALYGALRDAFSLTYLHGGGTNCTTAEPTDAPWRRRFHHLTFYGFLLCFAATSVGTLYHYAFGWRAPYDYTSLPVLLGTAGGIGLIIGPAGLYWLKRRRDSAITDDKQRGMDVAFIALLFTTSLTGLLLLALRETQALGTLLILHLAVVMALFLTLPYGKFVHGLYRFAALAKNALERDRHTQIRPDLQ
ncbi:MAG: tricarballylate utilization 4Fe-4S protein TcuB [Sulfurifustaceae bacterium]